MFSCNKVSKSPAACFYYFSLIFSAARCTFFSVALPIFVEKLHKIKTILNFKSTGDFPTLPEDVFYIRYLREITRQDTFPQAVGFPNCRLPQSEGAVLGATGVKLSIWTEPHTVHWTKVTLIGLCRQNQQSDTLSQR